MLRHASGANAGGRECGQGAHVGARQHQRLCGQPSCGGVRPSACAQRELLIARASTMPPGTIFASAQAVYDRRPLGAVRDHAQPAHELGNMMGKLCVQQKATI